MKLTLRIMAVTALALIAALFSFAYTVKANPSYFSPPTTTATATTSPTYITFGVGTTTLSVDTYQANLNTKADSAMVLFQFNATNTISAPTVLMRVEYSQDNKDWYVATNELTANASTTPVTGTFANYSFTISTTTASTDLGGTWKVADSSGLASSTALFSKVIATPARYVRVKFTMPSGGGKGAIWAELLPVKQNP